jgi:DNA-directed RNA polymerase omega subunit
MDRTRKPLELDNALEQYDSKFRFVLLASSRAEQLVRGARPKLESPSKKPTRVAMEELKQGMVPWAYGPAPSAEMTDGGAEGAAVADAAAEQG